MTEPTGRLTRTPEAETDAYSVWTAILTLAGPNASSDGPIGTLTPSLQRLHAMLLVDSEVNNGGFSQFFFNGGGDWLDDAIFGFTEAGLEDRRQLAIEAADATIPQLDALRAAREGGSLETYAAWAESSDLERFDDRWYELDAIDEPLDQFIADHESEIWDR
jgi:Domain of unknown function (DUF4375)